MFILYIFIGFICGVLQSMGLGGGSLLIPLLSFLSINQKSAQLINVFAFVVMVIFLILTGTQKGLTYRFIALFIGLIGAITSLIFSLLVQNLDNNVLKIFFGIFLLLVVIFEIISFFLKYHKKN